MPSLLLECVVRSTLIALAIGAILRISGITASRARHMAWAAVVFAMLLLPVWVSWGPQLPVRLLSEGTLPSAATRLASQALSPLAPIRTEHRTGRPETSLVPKVPKGSQVQSKRASGRPRIVRTWWIALPVIYLAGVLILLLRLAIGSLHARALMRLAVPDDGILTSDACASPITVGWLRPAVILPKGWSQWSAAQLDAVLSHEGEHARRRDPLVQWLALLNRAIFWFHPLAWWLERRLSALAEEACDNAVLSRGHDPRDYSRYLLSLARSVMNAGRRVDALGMTMPGSSLPRRIPVILSGARPQRISRIRMVAAGVACLVVSVMFAAGAVDSSQPAVARFVSRIEAPVRISTSGSQSSIPTTLSIAPLSMLGKLSVPGSEIFTPPAQPVAPPVETSDSRRTILYFDLTGMPDAEKARNIDLARRMISRYMRPHDLFAVEDYSDNTFRTIQDFTNDPDRLMAAIQSVSSDADSTGSDATGRSEALRTAANSLRGLSGSGSVAYFSSRQTWLDPLTHTQMEKALASVSRMGVSVMSVDTAQMEMASLR
jgi:beta-lactamase regulating signal transducer with metallopeptidase domain